MKSKRLILFVLIFVTFFFSQFTFNVTKKISSKLDANTSKSNIKNINSTDSHSNPVKKLPKELKEKLKSIPEKFHKYFQYLNYKNIITSVPYLVSKCEEYILIPCRVIKDKTLMDVILKEKCFVSINYNNIVVFNISDPDTLHNYIGLNFAKMPPKLVQGDPRCVQLDSKQGNKINFCLNKKSEAFQIIKSIKFFNNCKKSGKNKNKGKKCLELILKINKKQTLSEKNKKILKKLRKSHKSIFKKK